MEEMRMRKLLIASLVAAGIGFIAAPAGQAAPVNNTVLKQLTDMDNVTQVGWHNRWRSHWRWGSRGGGGGGARCHVRWRSWYRWC
jgi:hypothetical protein